MEKGGKWIGGVGSGKEGVWQIDIKLGTDGSGAFSETFYLAERKNFSPGPDNYLDASPDPISHKKGGIEIDIMETKWNPSGPQINLPGGETYSWNSGATQYINRSLKPWTSLNANPRQVFTTFGAYIKGEKLWIYAYKADGTQWYCTDAILRKITGYVQTSPFVPYIGTWPYGSTEPDNFFTEYRNFVYIPTNEMPPDLNPKDKPAEFLIL